MEYIEVSAKSVNEAITEACRKLGVTSDRLDYEVIEEGSNGFLGNLQSGEGSFFGYDSPE